MRRATEYHLWSERRRVQLQRRREIERVHRAAETTEEHVFCLRRRHKRDQALHEEKRDQENPEATEARLLQQMSTRGHVYTSCLPHTMLCIPLVIMVVNFLKEFEKFAPS